MLPHQFFLRCLEPRVIHHPVFLRFVVLFLATAFRQGSHFARASSP